ncbi:MAG TPA: cysteine-rich CWC family protein [Xanthobacteraceae bacterium]|nr:cysteine-rich CWC family protein [Xanthobacteraceae bacterium]
MASRPNSALVSRFRSSHHCAAHSFTNFGIKGTLAVYNSSAVFGFEVPTRTRGYNDRNFKSTALGQGGGRLQPRVSLTSRRLSCARCGNAFECDLDGGCWCHAESFRLPMPEPASGQDCLCPTCLQAAAGIARTP